MTATNDQYTATVYTRPGCIKCRATKRALENMGVEVTMATNGWAELPLVEVHGPDETFTWAGMKSDNLRALEYLVKEAA